MKVEFFTFNDEVWCRSENGTSKLQASSEIVRVIYEKVSEFYPDAFKALNKEYGNLMDEKYKRFRIVNRFLKCNFGIIDQTLDLNDQGKFRFECVQCPMRGECKYENVICNPKFDSQISDAELRVLRLLYHGKSREDIADALCLSPKTVNNHIWNAYTRIGVHTLGEFIEYANSHNLFNDERM